MNQMNQDPAAGREANQRSGIGVSLARCAEVLYAPVEMFRKVAGRWGWSDWLVPMLVVVVASVIISFLIWPQLDLLTPQREALEARGMAQEQIDTQMAATEQFFAGPLGNILKFVPVVSVPVTLLLLGLVFWGAAAMMGGGITFGRTLSVACYAWMPKVLEGILLVFVLQGREQVRTDRLSSALVTNPASFLDPSADGGVLYALLSTLNPFTLWMLALVALGLSGAGKVPRNTAFTVVTGLFVLWILIQVGWAAAF